MFESLLKDIKNLNSKANWTNLVAGIILLLLLAFGSLWFFNKKSNQSTDENSVENNTQVKNEEGTKDSDKNTKNGGVGSTAGTATGVGGPVVNMLPNTSSK